MINMKPIFIVVERKGIIGNPINVLNLEEEYVTDSNHNELEVIGIYHSWKMALDNSKNPDRQIYVLKDGQKAWYKRKY